MRARLADAVARLRRAGWPRLRVVHHPAFRLPLTSLEARTGLEPRRGELALWHLMGVGVVREEDVLTAPRSTLTQLLMVHTGELVEALGDADTLGRIFGVEAWDVPVDSMINAIHRVVGGTTLALRTALDGRGPILCLQGGFHHAAPGAHGGFCPVNDLAVGLAVLRREGFSGKVAILDLDAHPPDGTAACVADWPDVWLGSLSGSDWGPLPGDVDETVLPPGTGDAAYLEALDGLLDRMPEATLWVVIAGGDVVAEDPVGQLGLTEAGAMERDRRVRRAAGRRPQVWLPAGGYGDGSWRRLAHTALALAQRWPRIIRPGVDPLVGRFRAVSRGLPAAVTGDDDGWLDESDLGGLFGRPVERRFLGRYTAAGVLVALARFGLVGHLERLGYRHPEVQLDRTSAGERLRVRAQDAEGRGHTVMEVVLEVARQGALGVGLPGCDADEQVLVVHWLTLRHPLATFRDGRPQLPGQEVPGLGLARETMEALRRMAVRLDCVALVVRPAWYHVAYTARHAFRFVDPERQECFEWLQSALAHRPLLEATHAVAAGTVRDAHGEPLSWDPAWMAAWADPAQRWPDGTAEDADLGLGFGSG